MAADPEQLLILSSCWSWSAADSGAAAGALSDQSLALPPLITVFLLIGFLILMLRMDQAW